MIDSKDLQLIKIIQHGLPITSRPFNEIGNQIGMNESEVIERLTCLKNTGLIKRFGVIVRHQRLGYTANAMVVFNIPDQSVVKVGEMISQAKYVNLCYQRPRQGTNWPYNLYCMIHGKNRSKVLQQLDQLIDTCKLSQFEREILFSRHCFKQRGAFYCAPTASSDLAVSVAHG